ncbi:type VI secretion system-associated FHA domain protein TagH [Rhizobium jaguaris]|uniref:Type VI secretion system-associated FHA domain protein TagH n=1 Tax=Rhizobium jaguaris TaxID=1312183 RepID=A0A387FRG1_9HYPH|nr:type VI secretion system-associated FHA domain protein TagH [Rhizobium jaguaris]AYG61910.1 type VI secretion system-associated FHA domain protein TagH [Rhizobium jaguaris]
MKVRLSLVDASEQTEHTFGPDGGIFGRSAKCDWVLPDPEHILSSVHGRIQFSNGRYLLIDESTNGIVLDGRQDPLGRGNSIVLQDKLRFRAAKYLIEAQMVREADQGLPVLQASGLQQSAPSPWPDAPVPLAGKRRVEPVLRNDGLFDGAAGRNSQDPLAYLDTPAPMDIAGPRVASHPAPGFPAQNARQGGYHAGFGGTPAVASPVLPAADGSLDDLFAAAPGPRGIGPSVELPISAAQVQAFAVPPLAPTLAQPVALPPAAIPQPAPEPPPVATRSIPEDFLASFGASRQSGLSTVPALSPANPDSSARPSSAAPPAQPATKLIPDDFDPLTAFGPPRTFVPQAVPAEVPVRISVPSAPLPPVAAARPPEPLSPALLADFVKVETPAAATRAGNGNVAGEPFDPLEAMKSRREERKAALLEKAKGNGNAGPPIPPPPSAAAVPAVSATALPDLPKSPPMPAGSELPPESIPVIANPGAAAADLTIIAALFTGMGFPAERVTAERGSTIAKEAGEVVRETAEGLIALLAARRLLKTEFRMDETQVQPEENNALKHFKIAELALDELFLTKGGGFQPPAESVASAFADLQQHAVLTMSAMQRAINLLFRRLSPDVIARDAEDEGGLRIRGLGARKGKWETYVESHARMSGNIDGVARQIIAEAFAQVQEEQARKAASAYWEKKQ